MNRVHKTLWSETAQHGGQTVAQTDMSTLLVAAVKSLGRESRVMLAQLDGVVIDLR